MGVVRDRKSGKVIGFHGPFPSNLLKERFHKYIHKECPICKGSVRQLINVEIGIIIDRDIPTFISYCERCEKILV